MSTSPDTSGVYAILVALGLIACGGPKRIVPPLPSQIEHAQPAPVPSPDDDELPESYSDDVLEVAAAPANTIMSSSGVLCACPDTTVSVPTSDYQTIHSTRFGDSTLERSTP